MGEVLAGTSVRVTVKPLPSGVSPEVEARTLPVRSIIEIGEPLAWAIVTGLPSLVAVAPVNWMLPK